MIRKAPLVEVFVVVAGLSVVFARQRVSSSRAFTPASFLVTAKKTPRINPEMVPG
jgi:hypothetical protein